MAEAVYKSHVWVDDHLDVSSSCCSEQSLISVIHPHILSPKASNCYPSVPAIRYLEDSRLALNKIPSSSPNGARPPAPNCLRNNEFLYTTEISQPQIVSTDESCNGYYWTPEKTFSLKESHSSQQLFDVATNLNETSFSDYLPTPLAIHSFETSPKYPTLKNHENEFIANADCTAAPSTSSSNSDVQINSGIEEPTVEQIQKKGVSLVNNKRMREKGLQSGAELSSSDVVEGNSPNSISGEKSACLPSPARLRSEMGSLRGPVASRRKLMELGGTRASSISDSRKSSKAKILRFRVSNSYASSEDDDLQSHSVSDETDEQATTARTKNPDSDRANGNPGCSEGKTTKQHTAEQRGIQTDTRMLSYPSKSSLKHRQHSTTETQTLTQMWEADSSPTDAQTELLEECNDKKSINETDSPSSHPHSRRSCPPQSSQDVIEELNNNDNNSHSTINDNGFIYPPSESFHGKTLHKSSLLGSGLSPSCIPIEGTPSEPLVSANSPMKPPPTAVRKQPNRFSSAALKRQQNRHAYSSTKNDGEKSATPNNDCTPLSPSSTGMSTNRFSQKSADCDIQTGGNSNSNWGRDLEVPVRKVSRDYPIPKWMLKNNVLSAGYHCPYQYNRTFMGTHGVINYDIAGKADGDLVVCFHGLNATRLTFQEVQDVLSKYNYRILTFDLYGHGLSACPKYRSSVSPCFCRFGGSPSTYSLDFFILQIEELLDHLGLLESRFSLIGFSMGGVIASGFAKKHSSQVDRLILISTAGMLAKKPPPPVRVLKSCRCIISCASKCVCRCCCRRKQFMKKFQKEEIDSGMAEALWSRLMWQLFVKKGVVEAFLGCVVNVPMWSAETLFREVGASTIPVMILWGTEDSVAPIKCAKNVIGCFPNGHLIVFSAASHLVLADQPQATIALILTFLEFPRDCNLKEWRYLLPFSPRGQYVPRQNRCPVGFSQREFLRHLNFRPRLFVKLPVASPRSTSTRSINSQKSFNPQLFDPENSPRGGLSTKTKDSSVREATSQQD